MRPRYFVPDTSSQILRPRYCVLLQRFTWDASFGTPYMGRPIWDALFGTLYLGRLIWDAFFLPCPKLTAHERNREGGRAEDRVLLDLPTSRPPDLPHRYNPPHSTRMSDDVSSHVRAVRALSLGAPNTMKHTLRCHDFGLTMVDVLNRTRLARHDSGLTVGQNRASPRGVAARIAASFVANLANTASIGCGSLRAIDDSDSQRTRVSLC